MRGDDLDYCLSLGYFRAQQQMFSCELVPFDDTSCIALWLRIVLANVTYGKTQRLLLRKNDRFSVAVRPLMPTGLGELEALYAPYRASIDFDAPMTVRDCLLGEKKANEFDTQVLEVRDGDRLIAAGIFDNGTDSIAGIMNFYHPDYRRHSLGKYLMLQKMNHARQAGKTFYYPGYIIHRQPKFDYKLFACLPATELLDNLNTEKWLPFSWDLVSSLAVELLAAYGLDEFGQPR